MFKIYIFISETFLRVGPIVTLAILNILIIHKFLKIAKRRQSLKNRKVTTVNIPPEQTSMSSSPLPSRNISTTSTTQASSTSNASCNPGLHRIESVFLRRGQLVTQFRGILYTTKTIFAIFCYIRGVRLFGFFNSSDKIYRYHLHSFNNAEQYLCCKHSLAQYSFINSRIEPLDSSVISE